MLKKKAISLIKLKKINVKMVYCVNRFESSRCKFIQSSESASQQRPVNSWHFTNAQKCCSLLVSSQLFLKSNFNLILPYNHRQTHWYDSIKPTTLTPISFSFPSPKENPSNVKHKGNGKWINEQLNVIPLSIITYKGINPIKNCSTLIWWMKRIDIWYLYASTKKKNISSYTAGLSIKRISHHFCNNVKI